MQTLLNAIVGLVICTCVHVSAAENLLKNGNLENATGSGLPVGWEEHNLGTPATFATETQDPQQGKTAVRIVAAEKTRSYVRSTEPIAVAPGETVRASAWVKVRDVPTEAGAVILIAEFSEAGGKNTTVEKFNVADLSKQDQWQHIEGSLKVPPLATTLHVRMGFSYSQGTCWWDDGTVTAQTPLVCRIDLPDGRLSPARTTLPVAILNRDGRKGEVKVRVMVNKKSSDLKVKLSGDPVQQVEVPMQVGKPGKVELSASIVGQGGEAFTDARTAAVPAPIALSPPAPTHWAVEDGPATVEAWVDLAVTDQQRAGATLELRIEDGSGKAWGTASAESVADGTTHLTVKSPALQEGSYKLVAELNPAGSRAERPFIVIPRRLAKVTLNSSGFPVYDGKAIFPLGIFNGAKFKEQAEAGFTVTHAYNATRLEVGWPAADAAALDFFEKTQTNGMKLLFQVPMKQVIAHDWEAIRRRVRTFRNHPALLAWCEEEGFGRGDFKPDTLKLLRKLLQEEDPNHPFMVGDPKVVITRVPKDRSDFFPEDDMDLGMWWWYPFPLREAGSGSALEGDEGVPGTELVPPSFLVNAKIHHPIWVGVQAYKKKNGRYPTPAEYRSQAYIALAHGAKGLMWYGGGVTGGLFLNPEEGRWDELRKLVRELSDMQDVLMSPSTQKPAISPAGAPISVCLKDANGKLVLIAANRGAATADVTFSSPQIAGGSIRHKFEPYGVLMKELTSSSAQTPAR